MVRFLGGRINGTLTLVPLLDEDARRTSVSLGKSQGQTHFCPSKKWPISG
jgi:hypothetical protein